MLQQTRNKRWLKSICEAAEYDNTVLLNIAFCLENGIDGYQKDLSAAILIYDYLYDQGILGDSFAIILASYLESGEGQAHPRVHRAMKIFQDLAKKGFPDAQVLMADFYWVGHHVIKNQHKSVYWYRQAAEQGEPVAMFYLGLALRYGYGCRADKKAAAAWILKAAEAGKEEAQSYIAHCYELGIGVRRCPEKAAYWYRVLADKGHVDGLYGLGWCYQYGQGVEQDYVEAEVLYRASIELGDDRAKCQLYSMLHPEIHREPDLVIKIPEEGSFWSESDNSGSPDNNGNLLYRLMRAIMLAAFDLEDKLMLLKIKAKFQIHRFFYFLDDRL